MDITKSVAQNGSDFNNLNNCKIDFFDSILYLYNISKPYLLKTTVSKSKEMNTFSTTRLAPLMRDIDPRKNSVNIT